MMDRTPCPLPDQCGTLCRSRLQQAPSARSRKVAGLEQNLSQSRRRGALARAGLAAAFLVATLVAATLLAAPLVAATLVAASLVAAAQGQSAAIGADVIFARKSLMNAVCDRMMVI